MKKFKKIILSILSLVLVAVLSVAGTLAYLTSEDSDVNVMTMGNVKIAQHEYERVQNADGSYEMVKSDKYGEGYKLQNFTQAKPLYPATGSVTGWGNAVYFDQLSNKASGGQKVLAGLENVQDKFVLVENTGKSDAYVRTIIAYEMGSLTEERFNEVIWTNIGDYWSWTEGCIIATIDGHNYCVVEATYTGNDTRHTNGVLPAGEYTYNSLAQVYMHSSATNEDVENIDGNGNGLYDILVKSQAVQTKGFADAQTALDTAFGKTADKAAEWFDSKNICKPTIVSTPEELINGLSSGCEVILTNDIELTESTYTAGGHPSAMHIEKDVILNLNGHKLEIDGEKLGFAFAIDNGGKLTITGNGTVYCDRLSMAVVGGNSTLNIENGKFVHPNSTGLFIEATPNYSEFYKEIPATINIYGGEFDCGPNPRYLLNEQAAYEHQSINVYGGTFKNFDPSNGNDGSYLADGYKVVEESNTYTVVAK